MTLKQIFIIAFFMFSSWISLNWHNFMNVSGCLATLLMIMSFVFVICKSFLTFWFLSLSHSSWRDKGQVVLSQQPLPGLLPQCPPHVCQYGPPEQYPDSAAPEPPARYMSYSQNLQRRESRWDSGERIDDISCIFYSFWCHIVTFVRVVITNVPDGISHHLLVIHIGPRCDLTTEQYHAGLTHRLCEWN